MKDMNEEYDRKKEDRDEELADTIELDVISQENTDPSPKKAVPSHIQKKKLPKRDTGNTIDVKKEFLDFLKDVLICMAVVFLLVQFIVRPIQVKGSSMYPTLHDGSLGFSNILGFRLSGIERFDIVIVYLDEKDEYLVKRVIGLPGETVSYSGGQLYINGEAVAEDFLDEDYVASYNGYFMSDVDEITLGEDEYYCLGDNRPHSSDSRTYGPFQKSDILSKGVFIFLPFSDFGVETW